MTDNTQAPAAPIPQQPLTPEQTIEAVKTNVAVAVANTANSIDIESAAVANRPGWRTSEFWLALLVTVAGTYASLRSTSPLGQMAGAISATLAAMGYGFSRSRLKAAP